MRGVIEFFFPYRLHRLGYLVRLLIVNALSAFLHASIGAVDIRYWWVAIAVLAVYGLFFIVLPRLRDLGMSPWWLIGAFVPFVNFLLALILLFRAPEYHFESSRSETPKT